MHRIRSMFNARSSVYRVHQRGSDKADKRETALLCLSCSLLRRAHRSFRTKIRNRVTIEGGERERRIPLLPRSIEFGSSETESAAKPWPRSGGSKKGTRRCNGSGNFWGREGVIHGGGRCLGGRCWVDTGWFRRREYESATTTLAFCSRLCSFFLFPWEINVSTYISRVQRIERVM